MTKITNQISTKELDQLVSDIFVDQSIEISCNDLDKMYFEFMNNQDPDANEKACATVSYFHLKKLLQCIIERKSAKSVSYIMVKDLYTYSG